MQFNIKLTTTNLFYYVYNLPIRLIIGERYTHCLQQANCDILVTVQFSNCV